GGYTGGGQQSAGNGYGSSSATSTPNFAREESPFGGNPMDISDDDLPF
ncbi:single-stranded DNA-binding protein, partial [Streptococcus pyogenes]